MLGQHRLALLCFVSLRLILLYLARLSTPRSNSPRLFCPASWEMPEVRLTLDELLTLIKGERGRFSEDLIPLSTSQIDRIKKCSECIAVDLESIRRNYIKKRSCTILSDLWKHKPELFILCALVAFPSHLASLDPNDCLRKLMEWWKDKDLHPEGHHPQGLTWIPSQYASILPGGSEISPVRSLPNKKRQPKPTGKRKFSLDHLLLLHRSQCSNFFWIL